MADTVTCTKCGRNNGLRRTACMYCGETLPVTEFSASFQVPVLKPIEDWESGQSVVLAPLDQPEPTPRQVHRLAEVAHIEEADARAMLDSRRSLPVARVGTRDEADLIARLLSETDLGLSVVSDESLELDAMLKRVRAIRLEPDRIAVNVLWGEWDELPREDVVVAVEGRIVATQVDIVEGRGKKKGSSDVVDTAQYYKESYAIDVYGPTLDRGFRIKPDSFDFASVIDEPGIRLDENFFELGNILSLYFGKSRYDASFDKVSRHLAHAWPPASHVNSHGLSRRGDFKKYTTSSVTTDGMGQFNRYSRLMCHLRNPAAD